MSTNTEIRCDVCGAVLSAPGPSRFRIYMASAHRPTAEDADFIRGDDPIPRNLDFCDIRCVAVWIAEPGRVS